MSLNTLYSSLARDETNQLVLGLRLLVGVLVGLTIAMFLLIVSFYAPALGLIFMGQQLLFGELFLYSFPAELEYFGYLYHASMIVYAVNWAILGALFSSGRRTLIITGRVLLAVYVLAGVIAYTLHAFRILPI